MFSAQSNIIHFRNMTNLVLLGPLGPLDMRDEQGIRFVTLPVADVICLVLMMVFEPSAEAYTKGTAEKP